MLHGITVPRLHDLVSASVVGSSDEIIQFLGASKGHTLSLTQQTFLLRTEATRSWEAQLSIFGHAIQKYCYAPLLAVGTPKLVVLTFWGAYEPRVPAWERTALLLLFPLIKAFMIRGLKLRSERVHQRSRGDIDGMLDRVDAALNSGSSPHPIGGLAMTYADVKFCCLAAPLLGDRIIFAADGSNLWARGAFLSFAGPVAARARIHMPAELKTMADQLALRPAGTYVLKFFQTQRDKLI